MIVYLFIYLLNGSTVDQGGLGDWGTPGNPPGGTPYALFSQAIRSFFPCRAWVISYAGK